MQWQHPLQQWNMTLAQIQIQFGLRIAWCMELHKCKNQEQIVTQNYIFLQALFDNIIVIGKDKLD